jgi:hypothetical protein
MGLDGDTTALLYHGRPRQSSRNQTSMPLLPTLAISASALAAAHDFSDDEGLALFHAAAATPWIEACQDLDNN